MTQMENELNFAFHTGNWTEICYGRLAKYIHRLFNKCYLPCMETTDYTKITTEIPVIFFDHFLWQLLPLWSTLTKTWQNKFVLIESEPHFNLTKWIPWQIIHEKCNLIITLNKANILYFQHRTKVPVVFLQQGYLPEEDNSKLYEHISKINDVAMPGCANSADRLNLISQLQNAGLTVSYHLANGYDLDLMLASAKIFVYFPASNLHFHYATQRIFWALNKGSCVVAVESEDKETERLYDGLYRKCTRDSLIPLCKELIESGKWNDEAKKSLNIFKNNFNYYNLFINSEAYNNLKHMLHYHE